MKFKEYIEQAARTFEERSFDLDTLHCHLGIVTEIGEITDIFKKHIFYGKELNEEHLKEEIGDLLWYIANYIRIHKIPVNNYTAITTIRPLRSKYKAAQLCLRIVTAVEMSYSTDRDDVDFVLHNLCNLMGLYEFSFEEVLDYNIAKLKKRYPDGFDKDKAINRK